MKIFVYDVFNGCAAVNDFVPGAVCAVKRRPLVGAIRWDAWYGELPDTISSPTDAGIRDMTQHRKQVPSPNPGKGAALARR
jgi:hypothetical protein